MVVPGFQRHPHSIITNSKPAVSIQRVISWPRINEILSQLKQLTTLSFVFVFPRNFFIEF